MYYLDPADDYTLYGNDVAQSPLPKGLFTETVAGAGAPGGATKKWTANVRLVDAKFYRAQGREAAYNLSINDPKRQPELELFKNKSDQDVRGYSTPIGKKLRDILHSDIFVELRASLRTRSDLGVISPNDCARFAMVLKNLISSECGIFEGEESTTELSSRVACFRQSLRVGEAIVLKFPSGGRHGITAVAKNRGAGAADQVVTLEAHASRWLTRPQFHLYSAETLNDLLMTWYTAETVVDSKCSVSVVARRPKAGELDVGTTVPHMVESGVKLESLAGRTFRGGPKTNKSIWDMIGSAGGVPVLLRGG